jgi:formylglycine-generating enzyme required for sulfatase activity
MIRQRGAILRALIRWCGADVKDHRRSAVIMLTAPTTMIGLLLVFAPPAAMSRQVGPKAQPPMNKRNSPDNVNPRPMPKMTKPTLKRPPAPRSSDDLRAKILAELSSSFVKIPAGEFMMGSKNGNDNEKPVHRVRISRPFEMGKYEVTQAQWEAVMGNNPSYFKGANLPVEIVSWNDVQQFIQKLNVRNDGYVYRLPTEAEWEYACRAGTMTVFAFGDSLSSEQANFAGMHPYGNAPKGKYLQRTVAVGSYQPNAWGLYDMHGNVWEWCQDWYSKNHDVQNPSLSTDPIGPNSGTERVIRGGSWGNDAQDLRSTSRNGAGPNSSGTEVGFRLVRTRR